MLFDIFSTAVNRFSFRQLFVKNTKKTSLDLAMKWFFWRLSPCRKPTIFLVHDNRFFLTGVSACIKTMDLSNSNQINFRRLLLFVWNKCVSNLTTELFLTAVTIYIIQIVFLKFANWYIFWQPIWQPNYFLTAVTLY